MAYHIGPGGTAKGAHGNGWPGRVDHRGLATAAPNRDDVHFGDHRWHPDHSLRSGELTVLPDFQRILHAGHRGSGPRATIRRSETKAQEVLQRARDGARAVCGRPHGILRVCHANTIWTNS